MNIHLNLPVFCLDFGKGCSVFYQRTVIFIYSNIDAIGRMACLREGTQLPDGNGALSVMRRDGFPMNAGGDEPHQ